MSRPRRGTISSLDAMRARHAAQRHSQAVRAAVGAAVVLRGPGICEDCGGTVPAGVIGWLVGPYACDDHVGVRIQFPDGLMRLVVVSPANVEIMSGPDGAAA
jgi:hypothetical protein